MATTIPQLQILPKAVKTHSSFPIGGVHVSTANFGATHIGYALEVLGTDKIDIDVSTFVQLQPMVSPTMGECNMFTRFFFVPYRFICSYYEDLFSGKQYTIRDGRTVETPNRVCQLNTQHISTIFFGLPESEYAVVVEGDEKPDFIKASSPQGAQTKFRLNLKGKRIRQILHGLGYKVTPEGYGMKSALPLLALAKIFRDFYVNPNFNYTDIDLILNSWRDNLSVSDLTKIFDFVEWSWFDNDIFTSAWAQPEIPGYSNIFKSQSVSFEINGGSDLQSINSPSSLNSVAPDYTTYSDVEFGISQYGLNILKAIRNFTMRQTAAGGRYIDQLLSRFGISLDAHESKRAQFLGSVVSHLNISRVDATAAGNGPLGGSELGDFAGRGTMAGNGHIHFECNKDDAGIIIAINHIIPVMHYYQGVAPYINHLELNDFFQADLENVGTKPIPYSEVFAEYNSSVDQMQDDDGHAVFGFAPNYYEYKIGRDILSGDFINDSRNTELESFELFRRLAPAYKGSSDSARLGEQFMRMNEKEMLKFNKIFLSTDGYIDPFILHQSYRINANRPMNSIGTSLFAELKEHGNDVGSAVKVRPNGKYF